MKKIINSTIAGLVLVSTVTYADSWYVGLEQSLMNNINNNVEVGSYSESNSESATVTSFKVGKIIDGEKGNHLEFVYNMGEKTANPVGGLKGSDLMSFSFNWNMTIPSLVQMDNLLPYLRLGLNYSMSDDKYHVIGTSDSKNYSSYGVILGIGGYYSLNNDINLFAGFDYQYRWWDTLTSYYYGDIDSTDKIKKFYIGAEYLF